MIDNALTVLCTTMASLDRCRAESGHTGTYQVSSDHLDTLTTAEQIFVKMGLDIYLSEHYVWYTVEIKAVHLETSTRAELQITLGNKK